MAMFVLISYKAVEYSISAVTPNYYISIRGGFPGDYSGEVPTKNSQV